MSSAAAIAAVRRRHWLTLRALHGEPVVYRAGDLVIGAGDTPLIAVPARVDGVQVSTGDALTVTSRSQDWLIDPDELIDESGDRVEPRHGHTIGRRSGEVYKVQPTDTAEDVWRWSEGSQTWRRVHSERQ
jgi:hypothetical protein